MLVSRFQMPSRTVEKHGPGTCGSPTLLWCIFEHNNPTIYNFELNSCVFAAEGADSSLRWGMGTSTIADTGVHIG